MKRLFPLCGFTVGFAAAVYYLIAGFVGGFGTSVLWVWLAAGIVLAALAAVDIFTANRKYTLLRIPVLVLRYAICFCVIWFFAVQILVCSGMQAKAPPNVDYLLVLGAQVKGEDPGIALSARLESAFSYLSANPNATAILCGGQGPGENITEAECMRRYLTERGIAPERLILESKSTSTAENVSYARDLVESKSASASVLTSHFHVWRSVHLARACGWENVYGEAAPFSPILTPHYMAREFLTITTDALRGNLCR